MGRNNSAIKTKSFRIRTLPSVQESHLFGIASDVHGLSTRHYRRCGISPTPKDLSNLYIHKKKKTRANSTGK